MKSPFYVLYRTGAFTVDQLRPAFQEPDREVLRRFSPARPAGPGSVLVHIEIEARARRRTRNRLWQYGCATISWCCRSWSISKAGSQGRPSRSSSRWSRAGQKVECLRRISECPELSGLERFLLVNCVETHLELTGQDAAEYATLRQAAGNQEVGAMELTWADRMIARGREEGLRDGLREGLDALKQVVLRQLNQRFGPLPEAVRQRVQSIEEVEPLTRIAGDILTVQSLDEVKL